MSDEFPRRSSSRDFFSSLGRGCLLAFLLAASSCQEKTEPPEVASEAIVVSTPLQSPATAKQGDTLFDIVSADESGIRFRNEVTPAHRLRLSNIGTGVASGDFDGDGLVDLYFTGQDSPNKLYRQTGRWTFEDVTQSTGGVDGGGATSTGPAFADIDNDGDLDLYVCNQDASDLLYVNQGDGTFVEAAADRGLAGESASTMAAFCDYDLDGDLDLYLLTYRGPEDGGIFDLQPANSKGDPEIEGQPDIFYQNDGTGHFTEATAESGMRNTTGLGLSATWWDYNSDGWPDLFVSNDFRGADRLYHNLGDGTFVEIAGQVLPFMPWFSMGSDSGDLNNDGLPDLIATDMAGTNHYRSKTQMGDIRNTGEFLKNSFPKQMMRNTVYVNSGVGRFYETANLAGMSASDWTWAVRIADFDNDGLQDVFFANGFYLDARDSDRELAYSLRGDWQKGLKESTSGTVAERFEDFLREKGFAEEVFQGEDREVLGQENLAFRNLGDLRFENVSEGWGFDEEVVSFGATVVDLDGDGDLDIVTNGLDDSIRLYRNTGDSGNRAVFRLKGTVSNRFGIGSTVKIETKSGEQTKWLAASRGYQGGDHPEVHFGLGADTEIGKVTVDWPSGIRQEIPDLKAGFLHEIEEPRDPTVANPVARAPVFGPSPEDQTRFTKATTMLPDPPIHLEQEYDDFAIQHLLPYQLSQLGAGLAVADIDGDGKDDVWTGGGMGQLGHFLSHDSGGVLRQKQRFSQASRNDALSEDMGGLFFDADSDDDLDFYSVSGSSEWDVDSKNLADRLYLNDGKTNFSPAPAGTLPGFLDSGSVVAAGDLDRDGDLDLFIGGRAVPGGYPAAASSRFLRNEEGEFVDATREVFGAPVEGLITGAIWSDIDADGWIDLLVTQEWGPVRVFKSQQGRMEDLTGSSGASEYSGWWNGIAGGDVDNDGDIDFVVSNFGLNTKYKVEEGKPRKIFYSDFDGNGHMDLVEAKYENGVLLPERGRSCSTLAMPTLSEKFPTYRKFAKATLPEIYTPAGLNEAYSLTANHLAVSLLINDGTGGFTLRELPRMAQISPSFGVSVTDFDGDGNADILLSQNFYPNQVETGPMNMGMGQFLRGDGTGGFTPVGPSESGVYLPDDSRGLAIGDMNGDSWPDALATTNAGPLEILLNRGAEDGRRMLHLKLIGGRGNRTAVGAAVVLETKDGRIQRQEVVAGSSYLSQSTPDLFFGLESGEQVRRITVRWPDGGTSQFVEGFGSNPVVLDQFRDP